MFGRRKSSQPEIIPVMPIVEQLQRSAKLLVCSGNSYSDVSVLWDAWNKVQDRYLANLDSMTR